MLIGRALSCRNSCRSGRRTGLLTKESLRKYLTIKKWVNSTNDSLKRCEGLELYFCILQRGTFPGISEAARFYRRKCEVDKIQNKIILRWSKVKFGVVFDRCSQVFFE